jgi:hypothetical protein
MFSACDKTETYSEKRDKEVKAIRAFIAESHINTITEEAFRSANYQTDLNRNEFVLFDGTGVYLQIVRKGCGEPIKSDESVNVLCRFTEKNLIRDSLVLTNNTVNFSAEPDVMTVHNTSGTYQGSFTKGLMLSIYGAAVPNGWLAALPYVNVGRPVNEDDEVARVRLIVPAEQGQQLASQSVNPYYYDITFERGF